MRALLLLAATMGSQMILPSATLALPPDGAIAVIVSAEHGYRQTSLTELSAIFRRKILVDTNAKALVPVNLPASDPLRRAFSLVLFHKEPAAMRDYWDEQYYQGVSPPHVLGSEEAVRRFVSVTPGAIGYVRTCALDRRVTAIAVIPLPPGTDFDSLRSCAGNPGFTR